MQKVRGIQVYTNLVMAEIADEKSRKGRSVNKIQERDLCFSARFFYKIVIQKKSFDLVINELSDEFFLSNTYVGNLINSCADLIDNVKNSKQTKGDFQKKWPQFVW